MFFVFLVALGFSKVLKFQVGRFYSPVRKTNLNKIRSNKELIRMKRQSDIDNSLLGGDNDDSEESDKKDEGGGSSSDKIMNFIQSKTGIIVISTSLGVIVVITVLLIILCCKKCACCKKCFRSRENQAIDQYGQVILDDGDGLEYGQLESI